MSGFWNNWTGSTMVAHARSVRVAVWATLLVLATAVMAGLPLFNVLGFEFSFALAGLGSLASADLGASYVRRLRGAGPFPLDRARSPGQILAVVYGRASLVNLALLVVPVILISLNALRVRNCDVGFGIRAFLLMPVASSLLGSAVGVLCGIVAGRRRRLSNALPFLVVLVSTLISVAHFYGAPQVFAYNMFVGYFPGNLYDESITFHAPFYWARLYHMSLLVLGFSLVAIRLDAPRLAVSLRGPRRPVAVRWRAGIVAVVSAIAALQLHVHSGDLGFSIDAQDIKRRLGGRHETANFIIYYPRGSEVAKHIDVIADEHEFRYAQLQQILQTQGGSTKIVSYFFANAEQKFRMMGARNVLMAKPWRREIYMQFGPYPYRALRHEIAHVIAGTFGDSLFHVSVQSRLGLPVRFNVGLIEGIAVAVDWPGSHGNALTPHQSVKAMLELGMAPPVDRVFSTGFLTFSPARSYTLAGSFVRFLLDTHGVRPLRALYRSGGDFLGAYGVTQSALVRDWRAMIDAIELPAGAAEVVRERFRRPGILRRPCPHAIGRARRQVSTLAESGRLSRAISVMRSVCKDAPQEPFYQLELAGLLRVAGERDAAAAIYTRIADDAEHISSSLRASALLQLAARAVRAGDHGKARAILQRAADLPLGEDLARNVTARQLVLSHPGPAAPMLREYFFRDTDRGGVDSVVLTGLAGQAVAAEPDLGFAHYLLGRNLRNRGAPRAAARSLQLSMDRGLPGPRFTREAARELAIAAYLAADYDTAARAARLLTAPSQPEMTRLAGRDWLARIAWKRSSVLPAPTSR